MSDDPVPRRGFFRMGLFKAAQAAAEAMSELGRGLTRSKDAARPDRSFTARPPGAVDGTLFFELCTRCNDCVAACPAWAIRKADEDEPHPGYPLLEPNRTACAVCEDPLPCVAACETGALVVLPRTAIRLGLARLAPEKCVVPRGQSCDFCVVYCPVAGEAIRMTEEGPLIIAAGCTGCGMCAVMCPEDAIEIGPVA